MNRDTGQTYFTQWFKRNRFELHPENQAPYDVLLGRLGDDMLRSVGRDWKQEPRTTPKQGCLFFEQTGHNVCDAANGLGFKTYWSTHGLAFDGRRGVSYQESLALFGLPLTEPKMETNSSGDRVMTQWFERARFEWHPEQPDPAYHVLLGLLGTELRGSSGVVSLPTDLPWVHTGNRVAAAKPGAIVSLAQVTQHGGPWQVIASANGKRLAFVEHISSSAQQVVVLDVETGRRRPFLVEPLGGNVFGLVFSPDGQQLAYTAIFSGSQTYYELRIVDLTSGSTAVRVTETTARVPVPEKWQASGLYARVVFYQSDAPVQGLVQIDPNTGAVKPVVSDSNYGAEPNPDGSKVALVTGQLSITEAPRTQLAIRDRSTGRDRVIVPSGEQYIGNPQWSADGAKIAYARFTTSPQGAESIRLLNADGTSERVLRLDSGAFPGALVDFAWRGSSSLLVLTHDGPSTLTLFEVPLSNFHPAAAKMLQTFDRHSDFGLQIVYVPR